MAFIIKCYFIAIRIGITTSSVVVFIGIVQLS